MTKSPVISIIIPVYNQKKDRLERCVNSIFRQSYQSFEVIIVNDGSNSECVNNLNRLCNTDNRIKLFSQSNSGAGAARNHGVEVSTGEYILFLDSDDMLSDYALEDAILCMQKTDADIVIGQIHKEKEKEWSGTLYRRENPDCIIISSETEFNEYINHILFYHSQRFSFMDRYFCDGPVAKLCKKQILRSEHFDKYNCWSEDTIWNLRVTKACSKIAISKNVWYYAFANEDSQTHVFRPNAAYEFKYRIAQVDNLISLLWPECMKGLYTQVWISTHYLMACFLLNIENKDSMSTRIKTFTDCIDHPVYQKMLKNISFADEHVFTKRIMKNAIRFFSLHGPKALAFFLWKIVLFIKKGER